MLAGRLLSSEVALRNDQSRFAEALVVGRRALARYRRVGDRHQQGRVLMSMAASHGNLGHAEEAIATLEAAGKLLDFEREPRLLYGMWMNRAYLLAEAERYDEADALLPTARDLLDRCGVGPIDRLRLSWLGARIAQGLGRSSEAEELMRQARREFLERGMGYDAALLSLELAVLLAGQGRHAEVRRLAEEMVPLFSSRDVHREALGALRLFCDAVRGEAVEIGLLREILAYLVRARDNPALRFRN